jgi:hypothetical protein
MDRSRDEYKRPTKTLKTVRCELSRLDSSIDETPNFVFAGSTAVGAIFFVGTIVQVFSLCPLLSGRCFTDNISESVLGISEYYQGGATFRRLRGHCILNRCRMLLGVSGADRNPLSLLSMRGVCRSMGEETTL